MPDIRMQQVTGAEIAYTDTGKGPPLLLLHGGEGDHTMFDDSVGYLSRHLRVIAYDQRDCGQTTTESEEQYDLDALADEAAELIAALGLGKAHVLGHSAGGPIAQKLAYRWPERVDRLILDATPPVTFGERMIDLGEVKERQAGWAKRGPEAAARDFATPEYVDAHPEFVAKFARTRLTLHPEKLARRMRALRTIGEIDFAKIKAPTLVLSGDKDFIIPPQVMREFLDLIPQSQFEVFADAGHVGFKMFPERFAEHVIRFLTA